ncbi:MAG: hypothetical protein AMJ54_08290 [Deltaproteobacteria bacterium SG8_13]|nr:MAG: hypothetical protein AMJ54_08290 [Deltaproteobacteria bacterium SG8_13]
MKETIGRKKRGWSIAEWLRSKLALQGTRSTQAGKSDPGQARPWRLLQVESAFACNLRCVMCPWPEYARRAENRGLMSPEIWKALKPFLHQVRSVDFTGGGEPLLQPLLVQWISEAHGAGCETGLLSNGFLLSEAKSRELMRAGIDWVCISMDGADRQMYEQLRIGSDFERVCRNVSDLAGMRSGSIPKLMINFVMMNMNVHQVEQIVRLASRLGVDQVNFKQCDVIRAGRGKGLGLFDREENRSTRGLAQRVAAARKLARKMGIDTTATPFTPEEQPVCDQDPRDSMFVRYDGTAAPCINLAVGGPTTFLGEDVRFPQVHYGSVREQNLQELWNTETCRLYRERFESRVQSLDGNILEGLIGQSSFDRLKYLQKAKMKMPAPPAGCEVCHYLYDL